MQREIRHQWFFPQAPEVVWDHLTNSGLLAQWLMPNDFAPVVGHRFKFTARPLVKLGFDGNIYCEVLEVVPGRRLVYTWRGGPAKERVTLDSVVTWTLAAKDGGTELTLEHNGFRFRNFIAYLVMNKGWLKIANRFAKRLQSNEHDTSAGRLSGDRRSEQKTDLTTARPR